MVPLLWFPRLVHGIPAERANWRLIAGGEGIHWPNLDEDISVNGLLAGRRSDETQESSDDGSRDASRPARKGLSDHATLALKQHNARRNRHIQR